MEETIEHVDFDAQTRRALANFKSGDHYLVSVRGMQEDVWINYACRMHYACSNARIDNSMRQMVRGWEDRR
jgi:hypothetical protein